MNVVKFMIVLHYIMRITNTNIKQIGKLRKIKSSYDLRSLIDKEDSMAIVNTNNIEDVLISSIVQILLHNIIYSKMVYFYKKYYDKNKIYSKDYHNKLDNK